MSDTVQRKMVGMVSGLCGINYEEKLAELVLTSHEEGRHQTDMLQVFKILTGKEEYRDRAGLEWQQREE